MSTAHLDKCKHDLGRLGEMHQQNLAASRQILKHSEERLKIVQDALWKPGATTKSDYEDLIKERGTLQQIIAVERRHLERT